MKSETKISYILSGVVLAMLFTAFMWSLFIENSRPAMGSTIQGNDYMSTTTDSTKASATVPQPVKLASGSLGSVIVLGTTTAASIKIYDNALATSTASSTLVATIPSGTAQGTYTFDRSMGYGILVDVGVGFVGSYVITYR